MKTKLEPSFTLRHSGLTAIATGMLGAGALFSFALHAPAQTGPGYALSFSGTNYVAVDAGYVPLYNSSYTIEAWIKPNSMGNYGIIGWGNYGTSNGINALSLRTNGVANSWWQSDLVATNTTLAGAWHHVAATYDGTWRKIYLDGTLVASNNLAGHSVPTATNLTIGLVGPSDYFNGTIDEVSVWNQALPQSQIQTNRWTGPSLGDPNLSAYWKFDEGSGLLAADAFDGNDGVLTKSPGWVRSTVPFRPQGVTSDATNITTASARLTASVHAGNLASKAWFQWGTTATYGANTPLISLGPGLPADTNALAFQTSSVLTNLAVNTVYHFRVAVTNSAGTNYCDDAFFTTAPLPSGPGCALALNGTNSYVLTPDLAASFPNSNVTMEVWFQPQGPGVVLAETGYGGWHDSQVEVVTTTTNSAYGDVRLRVWPLQSPGLSVGQVSYGTWNQVVLRYNQTNTALDGFLNGVQAPGRSVARQAPQLSGYGLFYGLGMADSTELGSGGTSFNGQIDEFRLWNLARSTADLQATVNRPLAGNEPGLVAYYRFDECSGTLATDTTGHGYDATLMGAPAWTNSTVQYGPLVFTLAATNLTTTSATLKGTAVPEGFATTAWFQWGTTTNYGYTTAVTNTGAGMNPVTLSTNISGLASFQSYHFRAVANNIYGTTYGQDQSFWLGTPLVRTLPGSDIATNAATLNATVTPSGPSCQAWFKWGLTTNYGNTAGLTPLGSCGGPLAVTNRIQPLVPGATYHYCIVATNSFSTTPSLGEDQTFTTPFFAQVSTGSPGLPGTDWSSVAWGDYDNDGYQDILMFGYGPLTRVYHNNLGNGTFTEFAANVLPGLAYGTAAWGDYNNDGRLDILLTGSSGSSPVTQVWSNSITSFVNINAGLPGVGGAAAWGDYDNDGRLDILLTGPTDTNSDGIAQVWRNTGTNFVNINAGLPDVIYSSAAWGDYDNDGKLDILLTGATNGIHPIARVYHNNGNGTFTDINAGLEGVYLGSVAWGDYDNDGNLDILLTGLTETETTLATIFQADFESGNNGFTYVSDVSGASNLWHRTTHRSASPTHAQYYGLEGTWTYDIGAITAGNLQSPPISLVGLTPSLTLSFNYFLQTEGGTTYDQATVAISTNGGFTWKTLLGPLPQALTFAHQTADLSAYAGQNILLRFNFNTIDSGANDFEGWYVDDVTIKRTLGPISRVYHNNGDGTFTDINAGLPGVAYSSAAWGDFDNDGRLDILLAGAASGGPPESTALMCIYHNNGDGTFTAVPTAGLQPTFKGAVAVGDYDNDGRLDILSSGYYYATRLYHNYWPATNNPPSTPANLTANVVGNNAVLTWTAGGDQQTPRPGLSYNLRVGTFPGGSNVVSSQAAGTGWRRVPQLGNMQQNFTETVTGLKYSSNYYWSVQAVDSAFAGSPFANEVMFTVTPAPSVASPQVGSVMGNSAVISAVVYPNGLPTTGYIQWGTTPSYGHSTASQNLGSGMAPVALRQSLTGLQPGTLYHYRIVTTNANGTTYGADQTFYVDPAVLLGDADGDGGVEQNELDAVLAGYWPTSPWLYMTNTAGLGGTNVSFTLTNSTAGAYSVWMSTNLSDWQYLGPAIPRYLFCDTNAPAIPQRFYRLSWP
jgi:hypothetical protein